MSDSAAHAEGATFNYVELGRRVYDQSRSDDVLGLAAELAFRFFLAMFPFAIFLTALGAFVAANLDVKNPAQQLVQSLGDVLPKGADTIVQSQLQQIIDSRNAGVPTFSALLALLFATGGMNAIIKSMSRIYDVEDARPIWRRYGVALLMTVVGGGAMIVAFLLYGPVRFLAPQVAQMLGADESTGAVVSVVAIAAALLLSVSAATIIFRLAPNVGLTVRTVLPGALIGSIGWMIATLVLNIYVTNFGSYANTYGALAGVAIILIWFYASALVFLVAGEVNAAMHEMTAPDDLERRREEARRRTQHEEAKVGQAAKTAQEKVRESAT